MILISNTGEVSKCFGVQFFLIYTVKLKNIYVFQVSAWKKTARAVRGSDCSPAIALSEKKDKLV